MSKTKKPVSVVSKMYDGWVFEKRCHIYRVRFSNGRSACYNEYGEFWGVYGVGTNRHRCNLNIRREDYMPLRIPMQVFCRIKRVLSPLARRSMKGGA